MARMRPYRQNVQFHKKTSWQNVSGWYDRSVGDRGSYFHEHVVMPGVLRLLEIPHNTHASSGKGGSQIGIRENTEEIRDSGIDLSRLQRTNQHTVQPNLKTRTSNLRNHKVLDMGCGQGVMGRSIPKDMEYWGVDIAPSLIEMAQNRDGALRHHYLVSDITKPLQLPTDFTHAVMILALQNIDLPEVAIQNASRHLKIGGTLVIVMNHPCFRIPRQTGWGVDNSNKLQYRKIFRYLSPLSIPVTMHPGQENSPVTWSYHRPLSDYFKMISDAGFVTQTVEEWASDKESVGKSDKMENRARVEIPLFMAMKAVKSTF